MNGRKVLPIKLDDGFNPSRFPQLSSNQVYNFYFIGDGGLRPTPGNKPVDDFSFGLKSRKIFTSYLLNKMIVVFDTNVYIADDLNSYRLINPQQPLTTQESPVYITENSVNQIAISDGQNVFIYDVSANTFSKASLPQGVIAGMIDFQDSYFLLNDAGTNRFYISKTNDGTSWDPLDWTNIKGITVGLAAFGRQVLVFGKDSTEIFFDAGVTPFPYQKINTIGFEYGCLARDSIVKNEGYVFWLGTNRNSSPTLLFSDGTRPQPLSDPSDNDTNNVDYFISSLSRPDLCQGFSYRADNQVFYQLNFTQDNISLLYNFTQRKFTTVTDPDYNQSSISFVTRYGNSQYGLSRKDGFLHSVDLSITTDSGRVIPRGVISDNFSFRNKKFSVPKLSIYLEQGIEDAPRNEDCFPCKDDAECYLSISQDNGVTFPITMRKKLAGLGFRKALFDFFNLGAARFFTFKMEFISPKRIAIFRTDIEVLL